MTAAEIARLEALLEKATPDITAEEYEDLADAAIAALPELLKAARDGEVLRYERDHAQAHYEHAMKYLTAIFALLHPPVTKAADGKFYQFVNPHANETLQALSDRIRAIPEELRNAAMKEMG